MECHLGFVSLRHACAVEYEYEYVKVTAIVWLDLITGRQVNNVRVKLPLARAEMPHRAGGAVGGIGNHIERVTE